MKSAEEILKEKTRDYTAFPTVSLIINAMEEYAQQQVNNCNKAAVSNSVCDLNPDFQQYLIEQGETKCKQCGKKLKAK
jgi:uncharacterized protein (UPF0212 family)